MLNTKRKRQLAEFQRLIVGGKSERFIATDSAQTTLFDRNSDEARSDERPTEVPSIAYQRELKPK